MGAKLCVKYCLKSNYDCLMFNKVFLLQKQLLATLEHRVPALLDKGQTNMLIVDSVTAVFRGQEEAQSMTDRSKDISAIGLQLHRLADKYRICILCVNQVRGNVCTL